MSDDEHAERNDADESFIEATFLELEYQPLTDNPVELKQRLTLVCEVWSSVSLPYEFLKLAHFLEGDASIEAQELFDAALRTAWRKRTTKSDPWDDEWWHEAVDGIADLARADALRSFARLHPTSS